jgi:hypothetical protein
MTRAARSNGVYVYCITEGDPVEWAADADALRRVYSIAGHGLIAVVSGVPLAEFGERALPRHLEDASWLEREARAHERVIERVMEGRTVLPMKLCTIFRSEARVRELLETRREEFHRALARLQGREEWEMKVFHQSAPPVGARARKSRASVSGRAYLMQKVAARSATGRAAAEAHDQAQRAFEMLAGCSEEIQLKPVAATSSAAAPRLILDAVCLLPSAQVPILRRQLESLGGELAEKGMRLQLVGPWPPYHFSGQAQGHVALP